MVEVSATEHDKITAEISHLPHAVAACLVHGVGPHSFSFVGKGFLDSTRIAQAEASIWVPIFSANRREVLKALNGFERKINFFKKKLSGLKVKQLQKFLEKSSKVRGRLT